MYVHKNIIWDSKNDPPFKTKLNYNAFWELLKENWNIEIMYRYF